MRARHSTASVLCVALSLVAAAGRAQPTTSQNVNPLIRGSEVFSEFSWDRDSNLSIDAQSIAFGEEPFHIVFSVSYKGLKLAAAPDTVEVLLVRDRATASDRASSAGSQPAVAIVDQLPVPLTKQTIEGPDRIKGILTFEVFQWIVGGTTLDFEAFGRRFVVVPNQLTVLKEAAGEWAHPGKH